MLSISLFIRFFFSYHYFFVMIYFLAIINLAPFVLPSNQFLLYNSWVKTIPKYIFRSWEIFRFPFFPSVIPKLRPWAVTQVTSTKKRLQILIVSFAYCGCDKKLGYCGRNIYKPGFRQWILLQYRGRTDVYRQNLLATEDNPGKNLKTRVLESGRLRVGVT